MNPEKETTHKPCEVFTIYYAEPVELRKNQGQNNIRKISTCHVQGVESLQAKVDEISARDGCKLAAIYDGTGRLICPKM